MKKSLLMINLLLSSSPLIANSEATNTNGCTIPSDPTTPSGYYITLGSGISFPQLKLDPVKYDNKKRLGNSPVFIGGLGYKINRNFRGDITLEHRSNYKFLTRGVDEHFKYYLKQDFTSTALRFNGYHDIYNLINTDRVIPYFTAGIGIAENNMGDYSAVAINDPYMSYSFKGKSSKSFTWSIGAGINIILSRSFHLSLGYRYADLGKFKHSNFRHNLGPNNWIQDFEKGLKLRAHDVILSFNYYL